MSHSWAFPARTYHSHGTPPSTGHERRPKGIHMAFSAYLPAHPIPSRMESLSRRALLKSGGWFAGALALFGVESLPGRSAAASQSEPAVEPLVGSWISDVRREGLAP